MEYLFYIFLFFLGYSYCLYPLLLYLISVVAKDPWDKEDLRPSVSIIISAYNEEAVIEEKIRNALALDYPDKLLEIIVSSDGSTDRTNEIVSEIKDPHIILKAFERIGKTACLNKVVPSAIGEIILFTDANSMFPSDLLQKMVKNFVSSKVGLVTGSTKYQGGEGGRATTSIYSKLEQWTKFRESLVSSCVGADGAIFAIRKYLYRPLKDSDINDFIIPLNVIRQGKRVVLDPNVICIEGESKGAKQAYRRQVRITTRTLWAIRRNKEFINIFNYGFFSFFIFSHKFLRLSVPFFFLSAFLLNLFILDESVFYIFSMFGFLSFIFLGLLNLVGLANCKMASICKYFLITFSAQFIGCLRMIGGIKDTTWAPQR